jgi:hypothetical protein
LLAPRLGQALIETLIREDALNRPGKGLRRIFVDTHTRFAVPDYLVDSWSHTGNYWETASHGFEQHRWTSLDSELRRARRSRKDEDVVLIVARGHVAKGNHPTQPDRRAKPKAGNSFPQMVNVSSVI